MTILDRMLVKHCACAEAREWAKPYKTLSDAWAACERGDWMLWLAAQAGLCSRQELVLAACACARLALPHVPDGEVRPLRAIETAEAWARGDTGVEVVCLAAHAAYAAYAYDAADAAAYAADATAYAWRKTRSETLKRCADIVRAQSVKGAWDICPHPMGGL